MLFAFLGVKGVKRHKDTTEKPSFISLKTLIFWLIISPSVFAQKLFLFAIPEQTADKSLISFSKTIEQTVLFSYEQTKTFKLNAVNGYYTIDQALSKLLRNSGLKAEYLDNHLNISIQTIPLKKAQTPEKTTTKKISPLKNVPNEVIEKIAIVGSRELGRTLQELPVPVDIFSAELLQQTGQFEIGRMLQTVAPSFNFPSSSISDGTDVIKPATLRGLGPDQTLILVNGKRRHHASLLHINTSVGRGTAGADLNAIPLAAIKHIEILRDGAAAQYGSDAIAGVINIVLKDANSAGSINASAGQYTKGDGETEKLSINKGFTLFEDGFLNATFNFVNHQSTNRSGLHGSCQFAQCELLPNGDWLAREKREINANRSTFNIGDPSYQQFSFSYNANIPIKIGNFYSFALYSDRKNDAATFFRHNAYALANPYLKDNDAVRPNGYLPSIHSKIKDHSLSFGYKAQVKDLNFDVSFTHGQNRIDYQTNNSLNASYVHYHNNLGLLTPDEIRKQVPESANAYSLLLGLKTLNVDLQQNNTYVSYSFGLELRQDTYKIIPGSQYSYFDYGLLLDNANNTSNENNDVNFNTNIGLAGIQGFPGIAPKDSVDEGRDVSSFYLEVSSNYWENFTLDAAIRYDNYENIGDTSNIKFASNWQVNEIMTLRGSLSTGFRAPSMQQLYFNNVSTQFLVDEQSQFSGEQIGTFRNDSQLAQLIGIPPLKEEQSTNLSLGAIFDFDNNLSLSLDYYAIEIKDRIVISNKLSSSYSDELARVLDAHFVDKAQVFLNGADTLTKGIDLIATWHAELYQGLFNLTLAGNFTDTKVEKLYTPSNIISALNIEQVFATQDISIIEEWQPKNRVSLATNYQINQWQFNLTFNHFGSYTITDGGTQKYGAEQLTDFKLTHELTPSLSWFIGANNIFDVMPDKNKIGNSHSGRIVDEQNNEVVNSAGVFKYSRRSAPFGFNGAYYYLGLDYKF